jgi:hypothetical protein
MEGIFIFKAQRQRNSLEYVPYYNADNQNENYQAVNIEKVIKKLGSQKISDIVCQNNLSNDFVRSALGLTEADLYEDEEDTITLSKHDKGVDLLIIWTDTKQEEPNAKKRFQSIRGIAGVYVGHDKKGIKHSKVSILCNAIASKVKTRKENLKKRGKQILQLIELLSRENNCEYITLDALDNVITYYHLFGYKLVNHPFTAERTSTTDYVKRLGVVVEKIRKVQERKTTRSDRKKNRMKDLMALLKEKRTIKEKLKRYMIGLYDVKERANFKYDYTPDTYAETGMDFVDELEDDGYKMYKSLRNNTANAASSTRKKNKKGKKKTRKDGGKKKKTGKKNTRKGGTAALDPYSDEVNAASCLLNMKHSLPILQDLSQINVTHENQTITAKERIEQYITNNMCELKNRILQEIKERGIYGWDVLITGNMSDYKVAYYNTVHYYIQDKLPNESAKMVNLENARSINGNTVDNMLSSESESGNSSSGSDSFS